MHIIVHQNQLVLTKCLSSDKYIWPDMQRQVGIQETNAIKPL